jgi:predicted TIM-barrel enzyme
MNCNSHINIVYLILLHLQDGPVSSPSDHSYILNCDKADGLMTHIDI